MFIWTRSLNLAESFFQSSAFVGMFNSFEMTLFHSFFFNAVAFFAYSSIISTLYEKKIHVIRQGLVSIVYCILSQGPTFLISLLRPASINFHVEDLFAISPPYFILLLYVLCVCFLKIDRTISLAIVTKLYLVLLLNIIVYYMVENLFFYLLTDNPAYQMATYFFANCVMVFWNIIAGVALTRLIKKRKLWLDAHKLKQAPKTSAAKLLLAYTGMACLLYGLVALTMKRISMGGDFFNGELVMAALACICVLSFYASYLYDCRRIAKAAMQHQTIHIHSLVDSIDHVRMLQHDMNNMMQAYEGYVTLENWEGLRKYHMSLFHKTEKTDSLLRLNTQYKVHPALLSLLIDKREKAQESGVYLNFNITVSSELIWMDLTDLARMVGILLDNAIEETMLTVNKTIQLSVQPAGKSAILLSVSNPTVTDVDTKQIMERAYSSKEGHNGLGLYTLWNTVSKTPGCRLSVEYLDHVITFYLEIPCTSA